MLEVPFVISFTSVAKDTSGDASRVYGLIAQLQRYGKHRSCTASYETIAEALGISERTVRRHMQTLEDGGYIERIGTTDAGTIMYRTTTDPYGTVKVTDQNGQNDRQIRLDNKSKTFSPQGSVKKTDPETHDWNTWLKVYATICGVLDADGKPDYANKKFLNQVKHSRKEVTRKGFTLEDVDRLFHARGGSAWYYSDWRGQRGQFPTPAIIAQEISKVQSEYERSIS